MRHTETIDAHDSKLRTCLTDKDWKAFDSRIDTLPTKEELKASIARQIDQFELYQERVKTCENICEQNK
jgi:hypothetical protein